MGSSYKGELEAIKVATEYARDNISFSNDSLHIFSDCQSAILAVSSQKEDYHNSTIRAIRENLMDISPKVQNIKFVYCPVHEGIEENELADSLAKTASKKAKHLQPNTGISSSETQQGNKMLSIRNWARRWENSKYTKYKDVVPSIAYKKLLLRATPLKNTSRKEISKIARLKTGHSLSKGQKSKSNTESSQNSPLAKLKRPHNIFF